MGSARARLRALGRAAAVRFGGLPHSTGTVDSPPPAVAGDITSLWRRNLLTRSTVVDPLATEIVTMTTHGERLRDVWLAIESIARGSVLPRRLTLWLDTEPRRLPWRLRRLQRRGLEVLFTESGLGVHTKYWPYLTTQVITGPLVTGDDDIVYPPTWLEVLREQHRIAPGCVISYRSHLIEMTSPDVFAPYTSWPPCDSAEPSYAHFATSVSGQLIPPTLQVAIRDDGPGFLELSPTADDIWLHRAAVLHGFPTKQITAGHQHWWFIPGSQTTGLNAVNVFDGGNDRQMAAAHTSETRSRIWQAISDRVRDGG